MMMSRSIFSCGFQTWMRCGPGVRSTVPGVSRCVLSSVLASVLGETRVYVSTRAEHHGPLGGGTLALIARVGES